MISLMFPVTLFSPFTKDIVSADNLSSTYPTLAELLNKLRKLNTAVVKEAEKAQAG